MQIAEALDPKHKLHAMTSDAIRRSHKKRIEEQQQKAHRLHGAAKRAVERTILAAQLELNKFEGVA